MALTRSVGKYKDQNTQQNVSLAENFVSHSTDGLWRWDKTNGSFECTARLAEVLGHPIGQQLFQSIDEFVSLVHEPDREKFQLAVAELLNRSAAMEVEHRMSLHDGTTGWFRSRAKVHRDPTDRPETVVGSLQPIDDVIQLRRQVAQLQDQVTLENVCEGAADMYAAVCAKTRRVLQCNQLLADALGYSKTEVVGRDLLELYHPSCLLGLQVGFTTMVGGSEVREAELQLKHKNGSPVDVSLRLTAVRNARGEVQYCRSFWRDIRRQKQLETQLRQREDELSHYGRISTLGAIATELAHELNQPLGAITNYLGGCRSKLAAGNWDVSELSATVDKVEREARRASEIVKRLRRMARKQPRKIVPVDVHAAIRESLTLLNNGLTRAKIQIQLALSAENFSVDADPVQLEQVIVNLVNNAREALQLTEGQRFISLSSHNSEGKLFVCVSDNGCGIASDPEQLFEPFQTNRKEGLGLGLSICRNIVRTAGGEITAEQMTGGGARFCFHLPLSTR